MVDITRLQDWGPGAWPPPVPAPQNCAYLFTHTGEYIIKEVCSNKVLYRIFPVFFTKRALKKLRAKISELEQEGYIIKTIL